MSGSSLPVSAPASGSNPSNPAGDGATPFDALLQDVGTEPASGAGSSPPVPRADPSPGANPPSTDGAQTHQSSTSDSQASSKAPDPASAAASGPAQGDTPPASQGDSTTVAGAPGTGAADQSSPAPATADDGDVSEAINALLKALQRAGFTSAAGTAGDAANGTDDGSPLSQLMGKLAKALGALEKDEKKGVPPSKDDLKQLQAAVTALSGYLATLQAGATANPAGGAATVTSGASGSTAAISDVSGLLGSAAGSTAAAAQGGTEAGDGNADAAAGSSSNDPLGQLADKIEALSSALSQTQPGLAGDLDQLAKVLEPGARGTATAPQTGTAAVSAAVPGASAAGTGKDGTAASAPPNSQLAQTANSPTAKATLVSHSSKPETGKGTDRGTNAPDKAASANKTTGPDKTDAASTTVDATDNQSSGSPSGTDPTGAQTAVATAPPQVPAGGGAAIAQQAQAAYQPVDTAAVNLPQMAFEIARHVDHGSSEFQIRLDPAELGRVDVKLAVDPTGAISAHLSAERPETLDLLRRDAGALNQALTQAGLDGSKTNLQFSLSQNPFTRQDSNPQAAPQTGGGGDDSTAAPIPLAPAISLYRGHMASSGLNIFV